MRIALLGVGLIGGSIARALRAADGADDIELVGWSPAGDGPRRAVEAGVLDEAAATVVDAIAGSSLVVLAGPVHAVVEAIGALARSTEPTDGATPALDPDATVTDVASTKRAVLAAADAAGLPFVGGHPMAGRETSGFGAADPDLFRGRPWVVVRGRHARPADVARVEWLARAVGARPVATTADDHDAAVARISALPLVAAAALAEAVAAEDGWPESLARSLASSGWTGATRLARGEPTMGAALLATNAATTADAIRALRATLDGWLEALEPGDAGADIARIREKLANARSLLER